MKRKQLLFLLALFMTVTTGAWAQNTNVVTQDNFNSFFDEYGSLLDNVTFDELIFQGEFSDLVSYITLDRPITIKGDNAVLNYMAFIIAADNVTLDNLTLVANSDLGNLIDIAGENVVISNCNITYVVSEAANAINVYSGANGVQILNNTIYFESTVEDYAVDEVTNAICVNSGIRIFDDVDPIEGLVIDGNKITAVIPAFLADIYENEYYVMGLSAVNGVRINGAEDFKFTNNTLDVTTNRLDKTSPTFQAMYVASSSGLIDGNDISMIDTFTPEGKDVYLYALELINDEDLTISKNNFNISTTGGKDEAGAANAIIAIASDFSVVNNNITTVSNGPNMGIYFPSNMGVPCDAIISGNTIKVTGLATAAHEYGLVSGVEIETGEVKISGNTIYTYNIGEYAEGNYIYGISYAQNGTTSDVEIKDNTIITEGHYAISFREVADAVITGNNLVSTDLKGNEAVEIKDGNGNTVEDNLSAAQIELFKEGATNQWMSWCDRWEWKLPEGCTAYTVTGVTATETGNAVVLTEVDGGILPAYTPLLVYRATVGSEAVKAEFSKSVDIPASSWSAYGYQYITPYERTFIAEPNDAITVYGNTGMVADKGWVMNDDNTATYGLYGDTFLRIDTDNGIPTNRCVVTLDKELLEQAGGASNAPRLAIAINSDNSTGITTLNVKRGTLNIDSWYTLDGRKLDKAPVAKGVFIQNGRKYVVR